MQTVGQDKQKPKTISNKTLLISAVTILFAFVLYCVSQPSKFPYQNRNLIEKVESPYSNIFIYKDSSGCFHIAFGYQGRTYLESVYNPKDPMELRIPYVRFMPLGLLYVDRAQDMLSIGLGGATASRYMEASVPQLHITEAELDPDVVKLAMKYFDFKETERHKVVVEDGRRFLMHATEKYDLIMIDAYRGAFVPFHLMTVDFYKQVKEHLKPGGAVVQNIEPSTMLFDSAVVTLRSVFDHVDLYQSTGNVIAIAYNGELKTPEQLRAKAAELQNQYHFRYPLTEMLSRRRRFNPKPDTVPLTDDFAPVDSLKAIERHNRKWE